MRKPDKILIDFDLFIDIYNYLCQGIGDSEVIIDRMNVKVDSILRREVFYRFIHSADPYERKQLRDEYILSCCGIFPDPEPEPELLPDPEPEADHFEYVGDFSDPLPF